MRDPHVIIRTAHLTEKGTVQREKYGQYLFEVATDANKIEIKRAIETIYDVKVGNVRTFVRRGKHKRFGRHEGKRPNWKRAIVTLKSGTIDLFDQV
jgi:large subunit ribosomal protein L23